MTHPYPRAEQPPVRPERPMLLNAAVLLVGVVIVLSVVATVLALTTGPSIEEQVLRQSAGNPQLQQNPELVQLSVSIAKSGLWFGVVLHVVLYAWLGWKLAVGRNWARVVLTVLGVLALSNLAGLRYGGGAAKVLTVVDVVAGIVVVLLVWLRPVTEYVSAVKGGPQPPTMGHRPGPMGPPPPGWSQPGPGAGPGARTSAGPTPGSYLSPPVTEAGAPQHPQQQWTSPDQQAGPRTVGQSWPGPGPYGRPPQGPYGPNRDRPPDNPPRS